MHIWISACPRCTRCAAAHPLHATAPPLAQNNHTCFKAELAAPGMDPNKPNSSGMLPLTAAVMSKDIKFVDGLLHGHAYVNVQDPATGVAPVQVAFQMGLAEVRACAHQ